MALRNSDGDHKTVHGEATLILSVLGFLDDSAEELSITLAASSFGH